MKQKKGNKIKMDIQYMEAFTEIDAILKIMPKELLDKIPLGFQNLISNKKSLNYNLDLKPNIPIENQKLKKETKSILSLINRNYLISSEERKKLELEDIEELKRLEKEAREKYNPDNIFKKKNKKFSSENYDENNQLPLDYSKLKWYQILYNKILKLSYKYKNR